MLLKEEFSSSQDYLETSINTLRSAAREIQECKKLHEILYMVLRAGNFLNAEGYAGNAAGFKMMSLMKLTDIRANKPSITLLHYVVEQVAGRYPEYLKFVDEIENVEEASKISIETLKSDMASLSQRVCRVSDQVSTAQLQLKSQMEQFLQLAKTTVDQLQADLDNLEDVRLKLADFLCEDSDTFKLEECFKVFHSFCKRFRAALQENEKRHQQERLAEARKKQREEQMAMKRRSAELYDPHANSINRDSELIINRLLGDMKFGLSETRPRDGHKKNKKILLGDDLNNLDKMVKDISAEKFKRHSDPVMPFHRDTISPKTDIQGELKATSSLPAQNKERCSFDSNEEGAFDNVPFRKSGRRKRVEIPNGDINKRERPPTPPNVSPSVTLDTEIIDPVIDTKENLRAKIHDWHLRNKKEEERVRNLQEKRKRKQEEPGIHKSISLSNTKIVQNAQDSSLLKITNGFSGSVESIVSTEDSSPEISSFHFAEDGIISSQPKIRKQKELDSERFIKKIQEVFESKNSDSIKFQRNRLYHSSRDIKKDKLTLNTNISKDDIHIPIPCSSPAGEKALKEKMPYQTKLPILSISSAVETKKGVSTEVDDIGKTFDRDSPIRKTQRKRLRKLELRREAENYQNGMLKSPLPVSSSELAISDSNSSSFTSSGALPLHNENSSDVKMNQEIKDSLKFSAVNVHDEPDTIMIISSENQCANNVKGSVTDNDGFSDMVVGNVPLEQVKDSTKEFSSVKDSVTNDDSKTVDTKGRRSSLRSRKSRRDRRELALSTTLTSLPVRSNEVSNTSLLPEQIIQPKSHVETEPTANSDANKGQLQVDENSENHSPKNPPVPVVSNVKDSCSSNGIPTAKPLKQNPLGTGTSKVISTARKNKTGNILHKITISTETKSKISVPKSSFSRITKREPVVSTLSSSTTDIPAVSKISHSVNSVVDKGQKKSSPVVNRARKNPVETRSTNKAELTNNATLLLNGHSKKQSTLLSKPEILSKTKQSSFLPSTTSKSNFIRKKASDSSALSFNGKQNEINLNRNYIKPVTSNVVSSTAAQQNRKYLRTNTSTSNMS